MSEKRISDVQPGDRVIYTDSIRARYIHTVERVTKTQVIINGGDRFRRSDGGAIGATQWDLSRIQPATDELLADIANEQARRVAREKLLAITKDLQDPDADIKGIQHYLNEVTADLTQFTKESN